MIGPEQVGTTVDQYQFFSILLIHIVGLQFALYSMLFEFDAG